MATLQKLISRETLHKFQFIVSALQNSKTKAYLAGARTMARRIQCTRTKITREEHVSHHYYK